MEKAILKTLAYGDIFDFSMKAWEIHKWLIGTKASLREVERVLTKLRKKGKIKEQKGYYFLSGKKGLLSKRLRREKVSKKYLGEISWVAQILKIIPWIKLVGVSGSLAMENSEEKDDIDIFIITQRGRVFLSRIFLILILDFLGKRRKREEKGVKTAGKVCINLLLSEDSLEQSNKDIYLAHEVLQMRVLWERGGVYTKYLESNEWVFKYLKNWSSGVIPVDFIGGKARRGPARGQLHREEVASPPLSPLSPFANSMENVVRFFQMRYMGKIRGKERVSEGALYFHPEDVRERVLEEFRVRVASSA